MHRLNLDPRFRVAAAFGAEVVEANAESYMDDAWQQIGDVLAANAQIRRLHLATDVSSRLYQAQFTPLATANPERAFGLLAPVCLAGPDGRRDAGAHPVGQPDPARADLGRDAPRDPPAAGG